MLQHWLNVSGINADVAASPVANHAEDRMTRYTIWALVMAFYCVAFIVIYMRALMGLPLL